MLTVPSRPSDTAGGSSGGPSPAGPRPVVESCVHHRQAGREPWLNAQARQAADQALGQHIARVLGQPVRRLRGRVESAVLAVGINPRWGIRVALRRPGPPDGGLRLVA